MPDKLHDKLVKISNDRRKTLEELILKDVESLVEFQKEQYSTIGLVL